MSPDSRPGAPNAARGIVVVVVAGLIGLFLLSRGGTHGVLNASSAGSASHVTTTMVANVPTIAPDSTTTAPPSTNPPAKVAVAIYNGTGGANPTAAGDSKAKLTPLGYSQVTIYDTNPTKSSVVYYSDGAKGDAGAVAAALGIDSGAVKPASGAATLPSGAQSAQVVVVIGKDATSTTK